MDKCVAALWNDTALDIEAFTGAIDILLKLPKADRTRNIVHGVAYLANKVYGCDVDDSVETYLSLVDKLPMLPSKADILRAETQVLAALNWTLPVRSFAQACLVLGLPLPPGYSANSRHY